MLAELAPQSPAELVVGQRPLLTGAYPVTGRGPPITARLTHQPSSSSIDFDFVGAPSLGLVPFGEWKLEVNDYSRVVEAR